MKPICGIYLIENKLNGRKYIGQSVNCWRRINEHCNRDKTLIDRSISTLGVENFEFSILKRCRKKKLTFWEEYYIYKYSTYETGYNEKINKEYQRNFAEWEVKKRA